MRRRRLQPTGLASEQCALDERRQGARPVCVERSLWATGRQGSEVLSLSQLKTLGASPWPCRHGA